MKRLTLIALILAGTLFSQSTPTPQVIAFGPWPLCVSGVLQMLTGNCKWYTPGSETYMLVIPAEDNSPITAYSYTLTALLQDGSTKTISGVVARRDFNNSTSVGPIVFGGILASVQIQVSGLLVAEQTQVNQTM